MFEIIFGTGERGEVPDLVKVLGDVKLPNDVGFDEMETRLAFEVLKITERTCDEIVDPRDGVTVLNEPVAKVGPDKPSRAGYKMMHRLILASFQRAKLMS
jgi:hypothetical protein